MFQSLSWDKFNSSPPLVVQGTLPSGFNPSVGISLIQAWCCHRRSRVHFLFQSLSWDKFNSSQKCSRLKFEDRSFNPSVGISLIQAPLRASTPKGLESFNP